jgi:two-component system uhpT operon response regulator UhpA
MKRVVLSMHNDPGLVLRAMDAGADAYVSKGVAADELFQVLRRVMRGERVLSSDLAPPSTQGQQAMPRLSERERETLVGLLKDLPPKVIAAEMGISDKTLYRHRANLLEKLGARSNADLVRIARERGLLSKL